MAVRKGLGRGLDLLIPKDEGMPKKSTEKNKENKEPKENQVLTLSIHDVEPNRNQPRKQFDEDIQEAIKGIKPDNFDELSQKQDKTPEEEEMFKAMSDKINEEYNLFLIEKGKDEVIFNEVFTEEEYEEILEINAGNDVEINGNKLQAADFLEIIHGLFVA